MTLDDLPLIKVYRNSRATRLRLRVDAVQIRLTAPVCCNEQQIQNFIAQSEQWLIQTWQTQYEKSQQIDRCLPNMLQLFNLQHPIQILYRKQKATFEWHARDQCIWISDRQPEQYLKNFVIDYAQHHLPVYLQKVSQQTGLNFSQCRIRQAKTRWGSCNIQRQIMLNSALVLLQESITKYVCIHELAHTQHLNHSVNFWALVQQHDGDYQQHRKALNAYQWPYWWSEYK